MLGTYSDEDHVPRILKMSCINRGGPPWLPISLAKTVKLILIKTKQKW